MAAVTPELFTARVMHKRLFPKVNQFTYRVYYLSLPLARLAAAPLPINRPGLLSFHESDHGAKDGSALSDWIDAILQEHGLSEVVQDVTLIAMPRVLGYVFNPVSFWMCLDAKGSLRAVLSEVNNTFGETHCYLCKHPDGRVITADDMLYAQKLFHVSPFLERNGQYAFRFAMEDETLGIWIDYYHANGDRQLITALVGRRQPMTKAAIHRLFWSHPLITVKTIALIHWQAFKLLSKGIRYITKPEQKTHRLSQSGKPYENVIKQQSADDVPIARMQ